MVVKLQFGSIVKCIAINVEIDLTMEKIILMNIHSAVFLTSISSSDSNVSGLT